MAVGALACAEAAHSLQQNVMKVKNLLCTKVKFPYKKHVYLYLW